MLFGETVAVYCENHTGYIYIYVNALCGQNAEILYKNPVRTSQETHYVSATKTNRLMLFGEIVAVYCENHMEHINKIWAEGRVIVWNNQLVSLRNTLFCMRQKLKF
jgi:hypothetical protein